MTTKKGGRPVGIPVSPIRAVITHLKKNLTPSYEIVRNAIAYERESKNLKKMLRGSRFDTTFIEDELQEKLDLGLLTQEQYDKEMRPMQLQKAAYKQELEELKVDPTALQTAKWNIERSIDAVIKAGNDEKARQALKAAVKELGAEGIIEAAEEEELAEGTTGNKGNVFSLKMKDTDE